MFARTLAAIALRLLLSGAATAQTQPASPVQGPTATEAVAPSPGATAPAATMSLEDCTSSATQLGQLAENKTIPEAKLDRLDDLFTKLDTLCDARQFAEAAAVATDIKTMLDGH